MAADSDYVEGLARLAEQHQQRLSDALVTLEDRIADLMATAPLKDGNLFDLEWAIQSRDALRKVIEEDYLKTVDSIIRDYKGVAASTAKMLEQYGAFTKVSPDTISQLQKLTFQGFDDIGQEYLDVVAKEVYQNTLTGASFVASVAAVKAVQGGRLAKYAKQQVHDSLMQFDASVNVVIGKESGATHWKYVGRIIETTRPFCRDNEGKVFTNEEIESTWSGSWAGKASGDPFIVRGGYNCGHQFRPVFDEELKDASVEKKAEVALPVDSQGNVPELVAKQAAVNAISARSKAVNSGINSTNERSKFLYVSRGDSPNDFAARFNHNYKSRSGLTIKEFAQKAVTTNDLSALNAQSLSLINGVLSETDKLAKSFGVPKIRAIQKARRGASATMGDGVLGINAREYNNYAKSAYSGQSTLLKDLAKLEAKAVTLGADEATARALYLKLKTAYDKASSLDKTLLFNGVRDAGLAVNKIIDAFNANNKKLIIAKKSTKPPQSSNFTKSGNFEDAPWGSESYFDNPADKARSIIFHEFGHQIHQQYFTTKNNLRSPRLEAWLAQRFKEKPFFPTRYAATNSKEWFAENFALYSMGRKDMVDDVILELLEAIEESGGNLSKWKGFNFDTGGGT